MSMPLPAPVMSVAKVREVVAYLEQISGEDEDDGTAHEEEDRLWLGVLVAIANHETTDDPAALAAEAIKTNEIDFDRRCG